MTQQSHADNLNESRLKFPGLIHISLGGPILKISVNKKIITFEMHPWCGPIAINKRTGKELAHQSDAFLHAASLWCQQGKRMEGGLCRWDHEPKEILKHLGGRNYQIVGHEPAQRGE